MRPERFTAFARDLPDASELEQLRASAGDQWTLWWNRGVLYEVPHATGAVSAGAAEKTLDVQQNLGLVAFLINTALPARSRATRRSGPGLSPSWP